MRAINIREVLRFQTARPRLLLEAIKKKVKQNTKLITPSERDGGIHLFTANKPEKLLVNLLKLISIRPSQWLQFLISILENRLFFSNLLLNFLFFFLSVVCVTFC